MQRFQGPGSAIRRIRPDLASYFLTKGRNNETCDHNFTAIRFFAFVVFHTKRPVYFVRQQSEYVYLFEVFESLYYNYQAMFKPRDVLFIFLCKISW